jgi:hypothetical protein
MAKRLDDVIEKMTTIVTGVFNAVAWSTIHRIAEYIYIVLSNFGWFPLNRPWSFGISMAKWRPGVRHGDQGNPSRDRLAHLKLSSLRWFFLS